jgi:hypothetical protein
MVGVTDVGMQKRLVAWGFIVLAVSAWAFQAVPGRVPNVKAATATLGGINVEVK